MEITLDLSFIRAILKKERKQAGDDIRDSGASRALAKSQQRHDERTASAPDIGTLDCREGCTWCCHFTVDVRAIEAFNILDFVERMFTSEQKARVYAEIQANAAAIKQLDEDERVRRTVKCPFLSDGRCDVYAVRPQSCRNYHATDVTGCRQSYEEPDNEDIDPDFAPFVYQAGAAHVEAFSTAMHEAGYDVAAYELNCALDAARADPSARDRFNNKQQPFIDLAGEEVPPELDDL